MTLQETKPGMLVVYVPNHANGDRKHKDSEIGVIVKVHSVYVFVKFKEGATPKACYPESLVLA